MSGWALGMDNWEYSLVMESIASSFARDELPSCGGDGDGGVVG